ncbi:uncharacterized protein LOC107480948 [Arachis duranensis]|uniref:Uncharacterized protein LOC107480948 n=1 Tax=Arachis duranensis TaxID=130453 RepID=A0A6P4CTY7_ARADU|nr:uncharacterized protein LOC107480948 [Arachis duranensis]
MASEESFVVLVHHRGSIKRKIRSDVKFTDKNPLSIFMRPTTSYDDLVNFVLQKLGLVGVKRVKKFFYRIPISVLQEIVKYDCFTIGSDEDLQVIFHCHRQFHKVRTHELLAKLVDVVSSSMGSNRHTPTVGTVAGSNSRPAGISSSVPVYEPPVEPVASPLLDDSDDDDVEPDIIADDSGDDIGASEPAGAGGGSSSGTEQYPSHFSSLDLEAMRQEGVPGEAAGFEATDAEGSAGLIEFQVGQQFQDKDEAVLSVKTYSIRRGVQYKVVESDYRRYVRKCSEFGSGCTWLIRLSLRQRKGIWEVKRYNGPNTCLATSIWSDHRSLDYHVISKFIMPIVRADAFVSINFLLNATTAHFGFRPTYMRVWLAKQKAVAVIYGDWDKSYHELPRWVLGVQMMMPGTVAVLRTSPVRVGGQRHSVIVSRWSVLMSPICMRVLVLLSLPPASARDPAAESASYIRQTFKGKDARRLLVNVAYAKTEHGDESRRFGHMTTNISECVNSILKGVRNLPMCSLVKATYGRLAELFVRKGREAEA